MTMGTSAPPTGSTNSTPKASASTANATTTPVERVGSTATAATPEPTATPKDTQRPAGITTGRVVISSCSFRYVTTEPLRLTQPTSTVNDVAANNPNEASRPFDRNSSIATSAAAPPPTPLNSATS